MTNAFAMLRLLPMGDREKDKEILALRHQITVLERQLGKEKVRFTPSDRAFLAALLHRLPVPHLKSPPARRSPWWPTRSSSAWLPPVCPRVRCSAATPRKRRPDGSGRSRVTRGIRGAPGRVRRRA
ncbi:hypothetical protein [Streptomyces sp. NPDC058385]|uniref:hypothetical protein n=1 Tax=Streptomyces sp. NPDC058385 TaxID=3346473 RepID=UPI00366238CC